MADDQKVEDKAEESAQNAEQAADKAEEASEAAEQSADKAEVAAEKAEEAAEKVEEAKEEPKEEKKESPKVSKKLEGMIEDIEKLSVLELSELVKALESRFGVTAAAPVAVAAGGAAPAGDGGDGASEQTTFNVVLADGGANKISVIKVVRELVPTLGLKEAKDLVDGAPKNVLEGVNKEASQEAKTKLEAAGAKVELK